MTLRAVFPEGVDQDVLPLKLSPGIISNGHLFLTGITGSALDGQMPQDPKQQFTALFDKIDAILTSAGTSFSSIVEMTSYHIDLHTHFDMFSHIHAAYVRRPYPAWTAVGVADLRRPGALAEVRVIARVSSS